LNFADHIAGRCINDGNRIVFEVGRHQRLAVSTHRKARDYGSPDDERTTAKRHRLGGLRPLQYRSVIVGKRLSLLGVVPQQNERRVRRILSPVPLVDVDAVVLTARYVKSSAIRSPE